MNSILRFIALCWHCNTKLQYCFYSPANKVIYGYCPVCHEHRNVPTGAVKEDDLIYTLEIINKETRGEK